MRFYSRQGSRAQKYSRRNFDLATRVCVRHALFQGARTHSAQASEGTAATRAKAEWIVSIDTATVLNLQTLEPLSAETPGSSRSPVAEPKRFEARGLGGYLTAHTFGSRIFLCLGLLDGRARPIR